MRYKYNDQHIKSTLRAVNVEKIITHSSKIKHAYFTNDRQFLIVQSSKEISICPIDQPLVSTLNYTDFNNEKFTICGHEQETNMLRICTTKNIYNICLTDCEFGDDQKTIGFSERTVSPTTTSSRTYRVRNIDSTTHNRTQNNTSWWKNCLNIIKEHKWKIACATAAIVAGCALYKYNHSIRHKMALPPSLKLCRTGMTGGTNEKNIIKKNLFNFKWWR